MGNARTAAEHSTKRTTPRVRERDDAGERKGLGAAEIGRLRAEVAGLRREIAEVVEQQSATSEILRVIRASPADVQPVFEMIAQNAARLCAARFSFVYRFDGHLVHLVAHHGLSSAAADVVARSFPMPPGRQTAGTRAILSRSIEQIPDVTADPDYAQATAAVINSRSIVAVPMLRAGVPVGAIAVDRLETGFLPERQIELLQTFADQAVIAVDNVQLFKALETRTEELGRALQQQTATADVLKVISRSAFDLQTVLDTLTLSAARLCAADMAGITRRADGGFYYATNYNFPNDWLDYAEPIRLRAERGSVVGRALIEGRAIQVADVLTDPEYTYLEPQAKAGFRTFLGVPLLREGYPIGVLALARRTVAPFSDSEIELVETFADQAVIAIENVRLFEEVQAKTRDLEEALLFQQGTSDVLEVIGRSTSSLQPALDAIVATAAELCRAEAAAVRLLEDGMLHHAAATGRGDDSIARYSRNHPVVPVDRSTVAGRVVLQGEPVHIHNIAADSEYTFLDGLEHRERVGSALGVPLQQDGALAGVIILFRRTVDPFTDRQIALVQTLADQAVIAIGNVRLLEEVQARTDALSRSLEELRTAQDRLVQTEKLASLGQLTAGIAHEIKNPLNFVNNFAALSVELIDDLLQALEDATTEGGSRAEIDEFAAMLKGNLAKVVEHGRRADSIVKNMLRHSRHGSGEHRLADINALVEESLNLAYHGARAERPGFNVTLETALDPEAGEVDLYPQEITRVLLNLIGNGFYATTRRVAAAAGDDYAPTLVAATRNLGDRVEIRIRDNGTGIPPEVRDKMFDPFFTTKPAGEGTGLGLSLSHDIVVKQHAGTIEVETAPGQYAEFRIVLPRGAATIAEAGGSA